jgi:hypothetical protein
MLPVPYNCCFMIREDYVRKNWCRKNHGISDTSISHVFSKAWDLRKSSCRKSHDFPKHGICVRISVANPMIFRKHGICVRIRVANPMIFQKHGICVRNLENFKLASLSCTLMNMIMKNDVREGWRINGLAKWIRKRFQDSYLHLFPRVNR